MTRSARVGLISLLLFFGIQGVVLASTSNGSIYASHKLTKLCKDETCSSYGNINWKPTINASTPGALAVTITDSGLSGNIWGDEIGWVNLTPTGGGVTIDPVTGVLGGTAYSSVGGWINFSPTGGGVTLVDNGSGSNFNGWAYVSGVSGGWMRFDCTNAPTCIKTDWRTTGNRSTNTTPPSRIASVLPLPTSATSSPIAYPNPPKGELPPVIVPPTRPPTAEKAPSKELPRDTLIIPRTNGGSPIIPTLSPEKGEVLRLPVRHGTVLIVKPSKKVKRITVTTKFKNTLPKEFWQKTLRQPRSWVHRFWRSITQAFSFPLIPRARAAESEPETVFIRTETGDYRAEFLSPEHPGEYGVNMNIELEDGSVEKRSTTLYALPEGHIYTTSLSGKIIPVRTKITLTRKNASGTYALWTDVENPWWTKEDGTYSVVVPKGSYRLLLEARDHRPFGDDILILEDEGVINENIELSCSFFGSLSCLWPIKVIAFILLYGTLLGIYAKTRVTLVRSSIRSRSTKRR